MLNPVIEFLKRTDELDVAKTLLNTLAKYASRIEEYDNLGRWFMEVKDYPSAIRYAEKALVNTPSNEGMYACRSNLAKLYNHINDPKASLRYSSTNLAINPDDTEAMMEQVFSYFLLNQKDKSEAILRELVERPDIPDELMHRIKFNLGTYDLYKGKFQQGLKGFLLEGKKIGIWKTPKLPFKFWDGGIQMDKTIVIMAEGGIGDELINFRFMKHFVDLGMNPIWYTTRKDIISIFTRLGYQATNTIDGLPKDALWTYAMSLPIYLDVSEDQLWDGAYLKAHPDYIEKWKWISNYTDTKVGIRWTGNPNYEHDLHREIPLDDVYNVIKDRGYAMISLQRDAGADQVKNYLDIEDIQHGLETIDDTLAVIHHLDFVITSCTSIAHMSAAMGKPTYVIVPISAYYTWASTTDTSSIWYPDNVKVLRQTVHKSWKEPLAQLEELLP